MPVPAAVQMAISQRYAQLADSITHGHPEIENAILAPQFRDEAPLKLAVFEYDPLTVVVRGIVQSGAILIVHAQYVGVQGKNEDTFDRWRQIDGVWRLLERR